MTPSARFEMLLDSKEHEMHRRGQLMVIERMLGIVPHVTRHMQKCCTTHGFSPRRMISMRYSPEKLSSTPTSVAGGGFLPLGGTGKFIGGSQPGLQAHLKVAPVIHKKGVKLDTPIGPPHIPSEALISGIKKWIQRKNVPTLGTWRYITMARSLRNV